MWAVTEDSLHILQTKLEKLWSFLQTRSDLINAHLVDFFTEDTWDRLVPKDLQDELLSLSDSDLTSLPSLTTLQGERKKATETGDSKSGEEKSTILSSTSITTESETTHICEYNKGTEKLSGKCGSEKSCSPLESFRTEAQQYVLSNSEICVSLEEIWRTLGVDIKEEDKQRFVKEHMCVKKSHEVEVLSGVVAGLCHSCHIDQVVDIGSGKGYLSECLYLQHGLTVLGVDASDSNTHGAKKRNQLLEKQWTILVNRAKTPANGECSNVSEPIGEAVTKNSESRAEDRKSCSSENNCTKQQEVASTTQKQTQCSKAGDRKMRSKGGSFTPTTAYIHPDTDLAALVGIRNNDETLSDLRLLLTGLHTCGDLCPTMLRLFVTCPQAAVLCSVGCCYNLLTEQQTGAATEKYGFPLSQLLQTRGVTLGRTARMLSCQAVERIGTEGRLPAMSLFYRAVLQVIVRDKFGAIDKSKTVGKVAAKSKDFMDYVRRALRRLQMEHADLSDEEINSYFEQYEGKLRHLQAFIQLRACLAPCVEAIILLDRLHFLHEQPGVSHAALVPVFDPVISPRCYALVAIKE
ncbi:PREDICTED: methyltransferase-like protein 25 [Branchiostoma belcheri]|uniref:Methyltransferase-like protein 25 n=1 Tax=Branchiostoma belcheri TaxID=7741 RepID=A0A6P4XW63_BRABE|nr:PREDICTED: methyltransferase-like protein 25 [Branchiostoma belcheri]